MSVREETEIYQAQLIIEKSLGIGNDETEAMKIVVHACLLWVLNDPRWKNFATLLKQTQDLSEMDDDEVNEEFERRFGHAFGE